jgi:hypothetical protein
MISGIYGSDLNDYAEEARLAEGRAATPCSTKTYDQSANFENLDTLVGPAYYRSIGVATTKRYHCTCTSHVTAAALPLKHLF